MSTSSRTNHTKAIAISAAFIAISMIFSYIEAILPSIGIPGVKLGLANIIIIVVMYKMDMRYAIVINVARILLSSLMFSGVFAMLYSLAGTFFSMAVMFLLKKSGKFSIIGVSFAGGVAHNFGQILVAAFVIENARIFVYFPVLVFSGLISGIAIGIIAYILVKRLPDKMFR